jgi:hypothetical protein
MNRRLWAWRGCCLLTLSLLGLCVVQAQSSQTITLAVPLGDPVSPVVTAQASQKPLTPKAELDELLEGILRQRQALAAQRLAIAQAEEAQQAACWQKFAVNVCLSDARRARRQALEPLRQQELALNAQERMWRSEQREWRLQIKQSDTQDLP